MQPMLPEEPMPGQLELPLDFGEVHDLDPEGEFYDCIQCGGHCRLWDEDCD